MKAGRIVALALAIFAALAPGGWAEELALRRVNGIYELPVRINNALTLNFIVDTGAAEVSIPDEVGLSLVRAGVLQPRDALPDRIYTDACGQAVRRRRVMLRSLKVGSFEVRNVPASIGGSAGLLLLGQSFLARVPSWTIDNRRQVIAIGPPALKAAAAPLAEDVNEPDANGRTPLMRSVIDGNTVNVRTLLVRGADVGRRDNAGWTALMLAAAQGDALLIKTLAEAGADPNAKNSAGWTALLSAASRGDLAVVQALISAGADVNIRNNSGWTALMAAQQHNDAQMIQLLKKAGATN